MIRVLVVVECTTTRRLLRLHLGPVDDIEIVASAPDDATASEKLRELRPDVVVLDLDLPRHGGLRFLERMMRNMPTASVALTCPTGIGGDKASQAMMLGATAVVSKPAVASEEANGSMAEALIDEVRGASRARVRHPTAVGLRAQARLSVRAHHRIIAIGASTGGPPAIRRIVSRLPAGSPGIVIAQHMPAAFVEGFASRLDRVSEISVHVAKHGELLLPGTALVAPGDSNVTVKPAGGAYQVHVEDPQGRAAPSIDLLFQSVAESAGRDGIGVLLTGMGSDGAFGLVALRRRGGTTLAQDEASSVVYGMPRRALELGAVDETQSLNAIPGSILKALSRVSTPAAIAS
ncbi:MAG: chemotaxis-specific protein-glutamate methyltransferase CheB [Myxococcota bacterium]